MVKHNKLRISKLKGHFYDICFQLINLKSIKNKQLSLLKYICWLFPNKLVLFVRKKSSQADSQQPYDPPQKTIYLTFRHSYKKILYWEGHIRAIFPRSSIASRESAGPCCQLPSSCLPCCCSTMQLLTFCLLTSNSLMMDSRTGLHPRAMSLQQDTKRQDHGKDMPQDTNRYKDFWTFA